MGDRSHKAWKQRACAMWEKPRRKHVRLAGEHEPWLKKEGIADWKMVFGERIANRYSRRAFVLGIMGVTVARACMGGLRDGEASCSRSGLG